MKFLAGMVQSKTMWYNALITAMGVVTWVQGHSELVTALVPGAGPVLVVIGVIGGILRVLTEFTPLWGGQAPVAPAPATPTQPIGGAPAAG